MGYFAQPRETKLGRRDRESHALAFYSSNKLLPQRRHEQWRPMLGGQTIEDTPPGPGVSGPWLHSKLFRQRDQSRIPSRPRTSSRPCSGCLDGHLARDVKPSSKNKDGGRLHKGHILSKVCSRTRVTCWIFQGSLEEGEGQNVAMALKT